MWRADISCVQIRKRLKQPLFVAMKPIETKLRNVMLDNALGLAMNCPVDECNPADCPLYPVRQLDLSRRLEWFKALTDDDLQYLNAYHFTCMRAKLQRKLVGACGKN